ncbi:MAG: hypothetical protein NC489_43585, partial [Ruminococcus flavefaciens]|nr:hypothetical protein [Ruminococcus flavefaciens]
VCVRLEKEFVKYFEPVMDEYFEGYYCDMVFLGEWIQNNVPADVTVEELLKYRAAEDYPLPLLRICMNPAQEVELKNIEQFCRKMQSGSFRGEIEIEIPCDKQQYMEIVDGTYEKKNNKMNGYLFWVYDSKITNDGEIIWD